MSAFRETKQLLSRRQPIQLGRSFSGEDSEKYTLMRWKGKFKPKSALQKSKIEGTVAKKGKLVQIHYGGSGSNLYKGMVQEKKEDAVECVLIWEGDSWRLERIDKSQYSNVEKLTGTPLIAVDPVYPDLPNNNKRKPSSQSIEPEDRPFKKPKKKPISLTQMKQQNELSAAPNQIASKSVDTHSSVASKSALTDPPSAGQTAGKTALKSELVSATLGFAEKKPAPLLIPVEQNPGGASPPSFTPIGMGAMNLQQADDSDSASVDYSSDSDSSSSSDSD